MTTCTTCTSTDTCAACAAINTSNRLWKRIIDDINKHIAAGLFACDLSASNVTKFQPRLEALGYVITKSDYSHHLNVSWPEKPVAEPPKLADELRKTARAASKVAIEQELKETAEKGEFYADILSSRIDDEVKTWLGAMGCRCEDIGRGVFVRVLWK